MKVYGNSIFGETLDTSFWGETVSLDTDEYRGNGPAAPKQFGGLPLAENIYFKPFLWEKMSRNYSNLGYDPTNPFITQYFSSSNLHGSFTSPNDLLIITTKNLDIRTGETIQVSRNGSGVFSGYQRGQSSENPAVISFRWMTRGGDSYARGDNGDQYNHSYLGGLGFSAGAYAYYTASPTHGGGLIIIQADNITGNGTIKANGEAWSGSNNCISRSGGGIIIILTKKWSGTVGLNVSKGGNGAQDGSYAIIKVNEDGSETLMVHSQNGQVADLNGQTPVYGADASIAW